MVDWSKELGIDLDVLMLEAFWHPVARWENDQIRKRGEDHWAHYVYSNPEAPSRMAYLDARQRPRFRFTERQLQIAIESAKKEDNDGQA